MGKHTFIHGKKWGWTPPKLSDDANSNFLHFQGQPVFYVVVDESTRHIALMKMKEKGKPSKKNRGGSKKMFLPEAVIIFELSLLSFILLNAYLYNLSASQRGRQWLQLSAKLSIGKANPLQE